ncbi:hypothetical protein SD3246_0715 [Salmonella enterica subsp. enterica serovar Dublin str. SD3246]|uniref:Uncharacterized protein n=1 Tax=Salmonella enterica subsp. enterica serovar Dublin str. SD3246 TaxID=909945 RepID=A0A8X6JZ05_SALDU|nr:hypothetical protein SD3246_0715 [Salmonella enterica subsp. enterica serovar Dublin str. SD3246]
MREFFSLNATVDVFLNARVFIVHCFLESFNRRAQVSAQRT